MVALKTQILIKEGSITKAVDRIKALAAKALSRQVAPTSRPIIRESINDAFEETKTSFIPSSSEAGQLGIGEGGSVDEDRRLHAWRALLIPGRGQRGPVTSFRTARISQERDGVVFQIEVDIDEGAFFTAEASRVPTPDSDVLSEIPWMDWFINGQTIQGHRFNRDTSSEVSRTGRGIMIKGGLWTFTPRSRDALGKALDEARRTINRRLKEGLGARILRRLR
ncbi:MAG: hypothetical protein ACXABY_02330 [Candidatus Thorarchaeota archaeon]|jgi:hypothetical protein